MYLTDIVWWGYTIFVIALACSCSSSPTRCGRKETSHGLQRAKLALSFSLAVFLVFNVVTLSPIIPWQKWLLWSSPEPDQRFSIEYEDYQILLPAGGIEVKAGEYVEFAAVSADVTYGFGVFRPDNTMVFQMQVLPGRENTHRVEV